MRVGSKGNAYHNIACLCNRGVCKHPWHASLHERPKIAKCHGKDCYYCQSKCPVKVEGKHSKHDYSDCSCKTGLLGACCQQRTNGGRRPFVGIWQPHVEWHKAHLEAKASN